jgi:hypothetical protein
MVGVTARRPQCFSLRRYALTIQAEAGDLRRFRHHRQFLKFCVLDFSTQQPGQHRSQTRLSKFGNARLRRTLWIASQVAIRRRENGFRHKFERYIGKDHDSPDLHRKALTAITAKMARVVHAIIKTGSDYQLIEWRDRAVAGAATALKERERDDRDNKSKVGRSPWTTNSSTHRSAGGQAPFGPPEVDAMSRTFSPSVARCECGLRYQEG